MTDCSVTEATLALQKWRQSSILPVKGK